MPQTSGGGDRTFVEAVREANDIVDVVGEDVELEQCGDELRGLSPLRAEKTASFFVSPTKQCWYDFGDGSGGDVFDYVMSRDDCTFRVALRCLAERAGMAAPGGNDEEREVSLAEERQKVEKLLTAAASYYHAALPPEIRVKWLHERYGFTDETIQRFKLGWADGQLLTHLTQDVGATVDDALKTGLIFQRRDGRTVDFFQSRIIFPYWRRQRVVYLAGRQTERTPDAPWEAAKYKKLPTRSAERQYISGTVTNRSFYNEDAARGACEVLVTEGIADCIAAAQAGVACISPATTRISKNDWPRLLSLVRPEALITICNDAESKEAGEAGALATAAHLFSNGRDPRIATLPRPEGVEKVDLNDWLKEHSAEELRVLLHEARPYLDVLVTRIPADIDRANLPRLLGPVMARLVSQPALEIDRLLRLIKERFADVRLEALRGMLRDARKSAERPSKEESAAVRIRGEVFERDGQYCASHRDGTEAISSFVMRPTMRLVCASGDALTVDIIVHSGVTLKNVAMPRTAWHSRRDFLKALPSPDLQWTGTDDHVQGLLRALSQHVVPRRRGTTTLGYLETADGPRWVAPGVVIGPDGFHDPDEIVYASDGCRFGDRLQYHDLGIEETRELAQAVLPALLRLNTPEVILPVIGWFYATPVRPRIQSVLGHFPSLAFCGTAGAGKTSLLCRVFWPLFGVARGNEPYSATETHFALVKLLSSTSSIPISIDEYRPGDMPRQRLEQLHRFLRRLYCGETEERGRPDLTLVSYNLSAPVCLAGESLPESDAALMERIVAVSPNRNCLVDSADCREAFRELTALDLPKLAARYIQFALGRDTAADLARAMKVRRLIEFN